MIESLITSQAFLAALAFIIGVIVDRLVGDSKWRKVYVATIQIIAELLEETDIDVPDFLEKLIRKLHSINDDTKDAEYLLEDEVVKKSKGE